MRALILMGSPRRNGNTAALLAPFCGELAGLETETVWLYDRDIRPCTACRRCQEDWTVFGCPQADDVPDLFDRVLGSGLLVLATPIYSWYCTPPMKALLDPERGTDLFEEGMRRYCKHSGLRYLGGRAERHLGYDTVFMDGEKETRARAFARELAAAVT